MYQFCQQAPAFLGNLYPYKALVLDSDFIKTCVYQSIGTNRYLPTMHVLREIRPSFPVRNPAQLPNDTTFFNYIWMEKIELLPFRSHLHFVPEVS